MAANRKTVTIITSPTTQTKSLPLSTFGANRGSPTAPKQYRIEERKRTVYVTSDMDPSEWDTQSLNAVFSMADHGSQGEQDDAGDGIRRTQSLVETQFFISEDDGSGSDSNAVYQPTVPSQGARISTFQPSQPSPRSVSRFLQKITTPPGSPKRSPVKSRPQILFYHKQDPHYGFTNFSAHPVVYKGKRYPTSEHLFQSFKFHGHRPNLAEHIRTCSERPSVAFSEARRFQPEVRSDWKKVNIEKMEIALWHKFTQHLDLKAELLSTGDAELIEDSDKDAFWGVGADRRGRNELGKALEKLRTKLRELP
ncbi:DUF1768-domain-containing protein [Coprinopsis marcescibilis]|uniref:DUF1768-domain-containing protein n=1 Tax=Coprinopsis marcescibilis TaxID=230819 RepID=A0A5C3L408_COPMA|nr:DUF1768-domain-containing protein [Coprinopsis marcescibilis]